MEPRSSFTLRDAMVLVAATALAVSVDRAAWLGLAHLSALLRWLELSAPIAVFWMIAALGLRLLPPRPPLRRLGKRPGLVACAVASVYTAWSLALYGMAIARGDWLPPNAWSYFVTTLGGAVGSALPAAWVTLAFGRWRPEPTWNDRAGRLLGAYMIVAFWVLPLVVFVFR
jgi:hypothetical protein